MNKIETSASVDLVRVVASSQSECKRLSISQTRTDRHELGIKTGCLKSADDTRSSHVRKIIDHCKTYLFNHPQRRPT